MTPDFIEKIVLVAMAGGTGVVGKIVFDWLANRKLSPPPTTQELSVCNDNGGRCDDCESACIQHESLEGRVMTVEQCIIAIKREQSALAASFKAHAKAVNGRLDKGNKNFTGLREDIGTINTSLVKIATIIEERYGK